MFKDINQIICANLLKAVRKEVLVMVSVVPNERKRYTVVQLLEGATPKVIKALNDDAERLREGGNVGRELA